MSALKPASALEKVTGHILTEATMTAIATLTGTPLAALLPILSNSLASERHKARVEDALAEIDATLNEHAEAIKRLSDSQYKLINEIVLAILNTTHAEKVDYLKNAVRNSLTHDVFEPQESVVLSRVLRDISAEEADFLVKNFHHTIVLYANSGSNNIRRVFAVEADSRDGLIVSGLSSLGLMAVTETTYGEGSILRFTPIVSKLLVLLR